MTKILSIGEALFDYFPEQKVLGGAPLNFAVHGVQLGAQVALLTKIGEDELGEEIFDILADRGVDIQYIQWDESKPTGRVEIEFSSQQTNEPNYSIIKDVAWDYLQYNQQLTIDIQDYDCLYFGTLAQRNDRTRATIYQIIDCFSGFKMLDLNLRIPFVSSEIINKSIALADGLKLNLAEANYLQKNLNFDRNIHSWLEKYNLKWIVLTQGKLGTKWIDESGETTAIPVEINNLDQNADSVGAGDAVSAVIITQYLAGLSPQKITVLANQIGAYVASVQGATPIIPLNLLL